MNRSSKHIVIVRGKKAWWKLIFPFLCFCIALAILYDGWETIFTKPNVKVVGVFMGWTFGAGLFIVIGAVFGMVRDYHFDFLTKRYKVVKRVGIIGFGSWKRFKNLNYVSVFENPDGDFEVNLWYNENQHFFIDSFYGSDHAINYARNLSKELAIGFHNAVSDEQLTFENDTAELVSAKDRRIDAYFSQGKRPIWQTILAALCFTLALVTVYMLFSGIDISNKRITTHPRILELTFILTAVGVSLSIVNDYVFDLQNKQFRIVHNVGPFRWGKWRKLVSIDYISVFQKRKGRFQINLWYNTNKHFTISMSPVYEDAIKIGKVIAKKLNIDLLDASDPHNSEWVELP